MYRKRIEWIDICKSLAIIAIFCGHFSTPDGRLERFVYVYHLQLFFFLSGLFYYKQNKMSWKNYSLSKVQKILIPFAFFGILNIVFFAFINNWTANQILQQLIELVEGARPPVFVAGQLWFLPCLFCIQIIYFMLNKLFKRKSIILTISLILLYIHDIFKPFDSSLIFSINSIMEYLLFFSLGDIVYSKASNFDYKDICNNNKIYINIISFIFLGITFLIFEFGIDFYIKFGIPKIGNEFVRETYKILIIFIICISNVIVGRSLTKSKLLFDIGQNTLILMGVEAIIKQLIISVSSVFGINISIKNGLEVFIFCFLSIIFARLIFFKLINNNIPYAVGKKMKISI